MSQDTQPTLEWLDVQPSGVRFNKPGAAERNSSVGHFRTDAEGIVTHVAGALGRPDRGDVPTQTWSRWEDNKSAPSREELLAHPAFSACEDHPTPSQAEAAEAPMTADSTPPATTAPATAPSGADAVAGAPVDPLPVEVTTHVGADGKLVVDSKAPLKPAEGDDTVPGAAEGCVADEDVEDELPPGFGDAPSATPEA